MDKFWKTIRRWYRAGAKLFLLIAVLAAGVYWLKFRPVPVEASPVGRGNIVHEVMGTGTLEARIKANISSRISGRIEEVLVDQGDKVTEGTLLARLDDDQLTQQVGIAQASLETIESGVERSQSDLDFANAVLTQAQKIHVRYQELLPDQVVTPADFDRATEELEKANAGVNRAEAAMIEARKKAIEGRTTLEFRRTQLADAQIRAPFDGVIIKRERDAGNIVVPGNSILVLISTQELWVSAWVDETEMSAISVEQSVRIVFRSEPDESYVGKVVRLARETDRETREFVVDVDVFKLPENWAAGQRAEVYIETARNENVIVIPASLIKWRDETSGVFVNNKGAALWRPVEIGLQGRDSVEIAEGLQEGEAVIRAINPNKELSDRMRISVQ